MLCIALLFVFTQASVASAIGQVQHLSPGSHQHMLFSDISLDFDHDDGDHSGHHHHTDYPDADHDAGQQPGHHHHHGDVGASVFVLNMAGPDLLPACRNIESPLPGRFELAARHSTLERPPKQASIRV